MNQKQIFELIDKFDGSDLTELKVETEGFKITLKSQSAPVGIPMSFPAAAASAAPAMPAAPVSQAAVSAAGGEAQPSAADTEIITSPIVGTFYRSSAPDAPAFVDQGSEINAGDSICIIEAMKIMNKLEAEFACEIVKILAENGQMVEYGAPLFEVRRK